MTEIEQPPQNGIDPTAGDDDENNKARPADIEQDMREMERRKRVEAIMGSKLFREELERIVDSAREGSAGASGILQQLSDIVGVPVTRVGNVFKNSSCMVPINDIRGVESMGYAKGEKILRCKLAATFRLLDLYGWTQGLGAQITARLKVDQEYFLVNPYGLLYHEITASALNKVDMQGNIVEQGTTNFGVNKSHFVLHSVVHAARPDIRCAIYIGCSPVVAISSLKSGLLPLTKDACVLGEISTHAYTGLFDEDERNRLVRSLGPNSKVMLLANHGALCCGETIEEAFYAACHIVQACETQLKLLPVGIDNLVLIPEESRKLIYEQSRRPPEDLEKKFAAITADDGAAANKEETIPKIGSPPKWRVGGADFEALMRMLDNAGYRTGYIYRHPLIKSDPPKPKNDVELPPAVSSLGYLLEEEELFRQGIWKKGDLRKGGDRSRWLNSPNVYQKVEVLETGTPDPKKITKWVAEGSPTHSTPVRIEDPLQFVPAGTTTKEFKRVQQQIKDNRRADKISAGPQSHILEGVTWDEANRIKDATVSQTGDHVVLMGAASKGIIQRGFQHNATVYKAPYAKNPFDNVTDDELNEYKRTVERKKKSIHGEYTDTDFSESEALNSMQAAGAHAHAKHAQSEPETEHQVIQIQTQQAPIPSQAEVVLSDATLSFINGERSHTATNRKPPTGRETEVEETSTDKEQMSSVNRNNNNSDDLLMMNPSEQNQTQNPNQYYNIQNENSATLASTATSKCRRDLRSEFFNPTSSSQSASCAPSPPNIVDLSQKNESQPVSSTRVMQGNLYSLDRCRQPQICSVLLQSIQVDQLHNLGGSSIYYRGGGGSGARSSATSSTGGGTNELSTMNSNRSQYPNVGLPAPYRTLSHFGFNSPQQTPQTEHKHVPAGAECGRYRPMQRALSYEEIFATPRYEQLCQPCFEHLLRMKPELQRRSAASSSGDDPEDLASCGSSCMASHNKLSPLNELNDEHEYEEELYCEPDGNTLINTRCHASTQTSSMMAINFLNQIERMNYSEESTNVNYLAELQLITSDTSQTPTSPGASDSSVVPLMSSSQRVRSNANNIDATITDITEIWNFGNWQEQPQQQEENESIAQQQEPLSEHRIILEITRQFKASGPTEHMEEDQRAAANINGLDQEADRQLMTRDERQRRMFEFHEIWQDHVQYFGAKQEMEIEPQPTDEHPLTMLLETQEAQALQNSGWLNPQNDNQNMQVEDEEVNEVPEEEILSYPQSPIFSQSADTENNGNARMPPIDPTEQMPIYVEDYEQDSNIAHDHLMATIMKLQSDEADDTSSDSSFERNLFRTVSLQNIAGADDTATVLDISQWELVFSSDEDVDEKRDDEKPVTPLPDPNHITVKEKDNVKCIDEKDVDENENQRVEPIVEEQLPNNEPESVEDMASVTPQRELNNDDTETIFSPLEREILETIEVNKLMERESIFGRIDQSIRNKLTPSKLQRMTSTNLDEETFTTYTHVIKTPPAASCTSPPLADHSNKPHNFQFNSEPRPSSSYAHDMNTPTTSTEPNTSRFSRSWTSSRVDNETPTTSQSGFVRTVSSSTFVLGNPRKKRNFIQENIQNASKARSASKPATGSKSRKFEQPPKHFAGSSSPICSFKAEETDTSARLWVSLPPTPRLVSGQKRRSVSSSRKYPTVVHSSCSPYAKRRKPLGATHYVPKMHPTNALQQSVSTNTFFADIHNSATDDDTIEQKILESIFEVDSMSLEPQNLANCEGSLEDKNNATSSSVYYSADNSTVIELETNIVSDMDVLAVGLATADLDTTVPDKETVYIIEEFQPRLSGGKTPMESENQKATTTNNNIIEPDTEEVPSGGADMDINDMDDDNKSENLFYLFESSETKLPADNISESTGTDDCSGGHVAQGTSSSSFNELGSNGNNDAIGQILNDDDEAIPESNSTNKSQDEHGLVSLFHYQGQGCKNDKEGRQSGGGGFPDFPDKMDNDKDECKDTSNGNSSNHLLKATRGAHNLNTCNSEHSNTSQHDDDNDDSSDNESLIELSTNIEGSVQNDGDDNEEDDDNKPNTSAAAAKKCKKRQAGGKESGGTKKSEMDANFVVLNTECTFKDGTLHVTDNTSNNNDIQAPRCESLDSNRIEPTFNFLAEINELNLIEIMEDFAEEVDEDEDEDEDEQEGEQEEDSLEDIELIVDSDSYDDDMVMYEADDENEAEFGELTFEIALPQGSDLTSGELELELDESIFMGVNSNETGTDSSSSIEWSLCDNCESFIVECDLGHEHSAFIIHRNGHHEQIDTSLLQSLEVSQNEVNQAIDLEYEMDHDSSSDAITSLSLASAVDPKK